ncbi:MAG TPA: hypothetical protein VGG45_14255 [Terracidiphilus sp.]|jgi:hypothetical protein
MNANTGITAIELVEKPFDVEPQYLSIREAENELDQVDSDDDESEEAPDRLSDNSSVALCVRAWHIVYDRESAELGEKDSDYRAKQQAGVAFLDAMPPLAGYKKICDYIACVNQAYLWDVVGDKRAARLFFAAKLALSALRSGPSRTYSSNAKLTDAKKTQTKKPARRKPAPA